MSTLLNRRGLIGLSAAAASGLTLGLPARSAIRTAATPKAATGDHFPKGFLWGAASAGYQTDGNSVSADIWLLEHVKPTLFGETSGDANNSFELWPADLDLVHDMGLNTYRFSIEWARVEPEEGQISAVMLDRYRRMIAGCRERGLTPAITFNHFASPIWFAKAGGWTNPKAPDLFARYCETAARALVADVGSAVTLNEPQIEKVLRWQGLPAAASAARTSMIDAARIATNSPGFMAVSGGSDDDLKIMEPIMVKAHQMGRNAIKSVRPDLPVGVSLSMSDDQAVGAHSRRDEKRADVYGAWLEAAKSDDFIGIQNYDRSQVDKTGQMAPPAGATLNQMGTEIWPESLGPTVRYAHEATGVPVLITENGIATTDDSQRADYIPRALKSLKAVIDDGVPVMGYIHWALLDSFEWISGYQPKFGLCAVDRTTFVRSPKPSAAVLGGIARQNAI